MDFEARLKAANEENKLATSLYQDFADSVKKYENLLWLYGVKQKIYDYKSSKSSQKRLVGIESSIAAFLEFIYFGSRPSVGTSLSPIIWSGIDLLYGLGVPAIPLGIYLYDRRSLKKQKQKIIDDIGEDNFKEKVKRVEEAAICQDQLFPNLE